MWMSGRAAVVPFPVLVLPVPQEGSLCEDLHFRFRFDASLAGGIVFPMCLTSSSVHIYLRQTFVFTRVDGQVVNHL